MKKIILFVVLMWTSVGYSQRDSVITSPPLTSTTIGLNQFTFEVSSTVNINIVGLGSAISGATTLNVWYRLGGLLHPGATAPVISTANGWVQVAANVPATSATTPVFIPMPSSFLINVPSGTPVGIYIGGGLRYSSLATPDLFTNNILTLNMTPGKVFAGGTFPNVGTTNRKFCGWLTYELAAPCATPIVPGVTASNNLTPCPGRNFNLSINGNSSGVGQQFQWQISSDSISWNDIAGQTTPGMTTSQTSTNFYRCRQICSFDTAYSTPLRIVSNAVIYPAGTYTINQLGPTAGTNFNSFTDFFNIVNCGGIAGPIVLNVTPGTGPYNEQVLIENIGGMSPINTITINGNGEVLERDNAASTESGTITMDGSSNIIVDGLIIRALGTVRGYGVHMKNGANNNTIKNCQIEIPQNTTLSTFAGVVLGSGTTPIAAAPNFPFANTIEDNTISGGYYGVTLNGNGNGTANLAVGNKVLDNNIHDFYFYGIYSRSQEDLEIIGNDLARPLRTSLSSFYGLFFTADHWGATVAKNAIHDPFGTTRSTSVIYAAYWSSASGSASKPSNFYNNILYNLNNNGTLYAIWNASSNNWNIYHNSVDVDDVVPTAALTYVLYLSGTSNDVNVRNNVFSLRRSGTSVKHLLYVLGSGTRTINNNGYFIDYNQGNSTFASTGTISSTFADWQTNTSFDANSVFVNPGYLFASGGLLVPSVGALDGLGTNLLSIVPTDYLDTIRSNPPDAGAFEFNPPACSDPFALDSVSTTTTSILAGWSQTGAVTQWDVEWGPRGFVSGTAGSNIATTSSNPYNITGLIPGNCYDVYVRANCTSANLGVGAWVGPLEVCLNFDHDLALTGLVAPTQPTGCGDSSMVVSIEIFNNGTLPASNVGIQAIVSGAFSGTLNTSYAGPLAPGAVDTVVVGTLNTYAGGAIAIQVDVNYPVDQNIANNSDTYTGINLVPGAPLFNPVPDVCAAQDSVDLQAVPFPGLSYNWWDAATQGNLLYTGNTFTVPTSNTGPYFLEYAAGGGKDSLETVFTGTTSTTLAGAMFDVNALKTIFIESFDVLPGGSGTTAFHVYYKLGSWVGSDNTPANWTLVEVIPAVNFVTATPTRVQLSNPLRLDQGQLYGIYLQPISITLRYTSGALALPPTQVVAQNADLEIYGSAAKGGSPQPFGTSTLTPRLWNGRINYRGPDGCQSPRVPVTFNVNANVANAIFTSNQTGPGAFSFDASSGYGPIFNWEFGDGNNATGQTTNHTYATAGTYVVTLIATDTACNTIDTFSMNVTSTISLEEFRMDRALNVYPNPSSGVFNVTFDGVGFSQGLLRILSPTGQLVLEQTTLKGQPTQLSLDLSGQSKGVYILQLQTDQGVISRRLLVL